MRHLWKESSFIKLNMKKANQISLLIIKLLYLYFILFDFDIVISYNNMFQDQELEKWESEGDYQDEDDGQEQNYYTDYWNDEGTNQYEMESQDEAELLFPNSNLGNYVSDYQDLYNAVCEFPQMDIEQESDYENSQDIQMFKHISKQLHLPKVMPIPASLSGSFEDQVDKILDFNLYKLSTDLSINQQSDKGISYLLDQLAIKQLNFSIAMLGNEVDSSSDYVWYLDDVGGAGKKYGFQNILRIRKQDKIGGVIQILYSGFNQMKIEIKISQINQILTNSTQKIIGFKFQDAPSFYMNVKVNDNNSHLEKQKKNLHLSKKKYLSAFLIENDALNGTLNLKHGNKRWQRITNQAQTMLAHQDYILKYLSLKNGFFSFEVRNYHEQLKDLRKLISKFKKVEVFQFKQTLKFQSTNLLFSQYNMKNFTKELSSAHQINQFETFQIIFTLVSLLFECSLVTIQHVKDLAHQIQLKCQNAKDQQSKIKVLNKIWRIITGMNKQEIYLKMTKGQSLLKIFNKKYVKQKNKVCNFNDNIQVKALKATPSGLIPAGWTRDLRNRMTRHFNKNDFQFLKIQVTSDDDLRSRLYGGKKLKQFLYELLTNVNIIDQAYIPIGWTQSQLKTSSLWYTLEPSQKFKSMDIVCRQELISFLGSFDLIKNTALKAARIGQNLSTGKSVNLGNDIIIRYCADDKIGKHLYTDGIGMMSPDLVKRVQQQLKIPGTAFQIRFLGCKGILIMNNLLPPKSLVIRESMRKFQCTYPGITKYFDVLDYNYYKPGYLNRQIIILLSANGVSNKNIEDIQRQYIKNMLKEGVSFEDIIENDKGDFDLANGFKEKYHKQFNLTKNHIENVADILKQLNNQKLIDIIRQPTLRGILIEKYYQMFERLIDKSHIRIQKSARILGVIDDYGILEENQVYCTIIKDDSLGMKRKGLKRKISKLHQKIISQKQQRQVLEQKNVIGQIYQQMKKGGTKITKQDLKHLSRQDKKLMLKLQEEVKQIKRQNIHGRVMLTRNPCMHPADIRVVDCVSKEEAQKRFKEKYGTHNYFQQMPNCVIFPKKGKVPLTAQISGSDLDGDTFFITWDPRLIPSNSMTPHLLDDEPKVERVWQGNSFEHMIDFFCEFVFNNNLGRLANSHLAHADRNGAHCYQCLQLCFLHSLAVDYPKKGYLFQFPKNLWVKQYPHFMQKGKLKKSYRSTSILGSIYDEAVGYYQLFMKRAKQTKQNTNKFDFLLSIKFGKQQIKQACDAVKSYNKDVRMLLQMYGMQRQFQLFAIKASFKAKQNRSRVEFLQELRFKYFDIFFKGLHIETPFKFIMQMKVKKVFPPQNMLRKLILWFLISYIQFIQASPTQISSVQDNIIGSARGYLEQQKIQYIGLCWFSVPYLAYFLTKFIQNEYRKKHSQS